ncbi:unnamed protein product [Echinostoma caproni]|uniref:Sulfotransfer_1 domain-containing protein n=1 Tax=Echinostoma caproni TaxID=27848 RepID=A0A183ANH3_9TREM|nr:unnamed protein product [Echinostoma caproni]
MLCDVGHTDDIFFSNEWRMPYLALVFFLLLALGNVMLGLFSARTADLPPSLISPSHGFNEFSPSAYDQLVIYNRIPKTGSTSLVNLVYHLWKRNSVRVALLNVSHNGLFLNRMNQLYLVWNMTERVSAQQPLLLHGHFAYLNFAQFGSSLRPIYLNMVRDPLERLASYYYFIRFGDDFRPNLTRRRMSDPNQRILTFDECVQTGGVDCNPNDLWVQVSKIYPHYMRLLLSCFQLYCIVCNFCKQLKFTVQSKLLYVATVTGNMHNGGKCLVWMSNVDYHPSEYAMTELANKRQLKRFVRVKSRNALCTQRVNFQKFTNFYSVYVKQIAINKKRQ